MHGFTYIWICVILNKNYKANNKKYTRSIYRHSFFILNSVFFNISIVMCFGYELIIISYEASLKIFAMFLFPSDETTEKKPQLHKFSF